MSRETFIKEAADKYIDMCSTGTYCSADPKEAFIEGADFADAHPHPGLVNISQLWHNASEKPKIGEQLIGEDVNGLFGLYAWDRLASDWNMVVKIFELRRWAYIEDLLPEGGVK